MTKERKLAIQMWQEIVDKCRSGEHFNVARFKDVFCKKHNLNWLSNCYFCQYFHCFSTCPLDNCMSICHKVHEQYDVDSAEIILNALKGIDK